ncbi:hypothetical protein HOY82DRAFT_652289 [Tuber indicum]|nr:hypothetical protein HOY82DRAFT_652289 [Tuber indicum]
MDGFEAPRTVKYSPLYLGMAATITGDSTVNIAFEIHDLHCIINSFAKGLTLRESNNIHDQIRADIIETITELSDSNQGKFVGAGVTLGLDEICPGMSPYIWKTLDIVCVLLKVQTRRCAIFGDTCINAAEQADSAALECIGHFNQDHNPIFRIGSRNQVLPDADGAIKMYASELRGYNDGPTTRDPERPPVKIAFFSATPQGGGVALMRHALVRICSALDVDMKADAEAFRITKTNHNILQGVANSERGIGSHLGVHFFRKGADVIVIDDPQMPARIPLIKEVRLEVKIIYRSHIEVREDLVERVGSPQEQVWKWIWEYVKEADVFISHPVDKFVPNSVPFNMIG